MNNYELYAKIIGAVVTAIVAYHKYIMMLLNKKVDKEDCVQQQRLLAEKRNNLELLITERTKTIFKQQQEIKEDLKIIKEKLIEK
ncbi:hypothetical protein [Fusobacterium sp.]|uniref:hypothetical protein n=1 Tax=Fusobacterium sp. TaxID=68766 RepID=UPI0026044A8A|nr:hypothetical protein [Fusobacterium sp.]